MGRQTIRSIGSILLWIGAISIIASFLTKVIFEFNTLAPYSPYFFSCILLGIGLLVVTRV